MEHTFTINGDPVGKGRPRLTRSGRAYTPKKTKDYESKVAKAYIDSGGPDFGMRPVCVHVIARFGMPKSWSKKQKEHMRGKPAVHRIDIDNIIKVVMDSLNGVAFDDDKQVILCMGTKWWSDEGSVTVAINEMERSQT